MLVTADMKEWKEVITQAFEQGYTKEELLDIVQILKARVQ